MKEEKDLIAFFENKGTEKPAEAENWNLAAHWRLGSEKLLTAVIEDVSFSLQTSKAGVLLVIFCWSTVWIPKGTSVLLSDNWIWSRTENGTHPLLRAQLSCLPFSRVFWSSLPVSPCNPLLAGQTLPPETCICLVVAPPFFQGWAESKHYETSCLTSNTHYI